MNATVVAQSTLRVRRDEHEPPGQLRPYWISPTAICGRDAEDDERTAHLPRASVREPDGSATDPNAAVAHVELERPAEGPTRGTAMLPNAVMPLWRTFSNNEHDAREADSKKPWPTRGVSATSHAIEHGGAQHRTTSERNCADEPRIEVVVDGDLPEHFGELMTARPVTRRTQEGETAPRGQTAGRRGCRQRGPRHPVQSSTSP